MQLRTARQIVSQNSFVDEKGRPLEDKKAYPKVSYAKGVLKRARKAEKDRKTLLRQKTKVRRKNKR